MSILLFEVRAGIEPARDGFADRSVTASPPHLNEHMYVLD
jgi:hypothetical protein